MTAPPADCQPLSPLMTSNTSTFCSPSPTSTNDRSRSGSCTANSSLNGTALSKSDITPVALRDMSWDFGIRMIVELMQLQGGSLPAGQARNGGPDDTSEFVTFDRL